MLQHQKQRLPPSLVDRVDLESITLFSPFWNEESVQYVINSVLPYLLKMISDSFGLVIDPSNPSLLTPLPIGKVSSTSIIILRCYNAVFKALLNASVPHVNAEAYPYFQVNPPLGSTLRQSLFWGLSLIENIIPSSFSTDLSWYEEVFFYLENSFLYFGVEVNLIEKSVVNIITTQLKQIISSYNLSLGVSEFSNWAQQMTRVNSLM